MPPAFSTIRPFHAWNSKNNTLRLEAPWSYRPAYRIVVVSFDMLPAESVTVSSNVYRPGPLEN